MIEDFERRTKSLNKGGVGESTRVRTEELTHSPVE